MTVEMTEEENRIERQQVEEVFRLGGGELDDHPWELHDASNPDSDGSELVTFRYWFEGPPEWADEYKDKYDREYRTVIRDCLFGLPPEVLTDKEERTWRLLGHYVSSGETECPFKEACERGEEWAEEHGGDRPCGLCDAGEGEDHGFIYLGEGWSEVVYRADEESEESEESEEENDGEVFVYGRDGNGATESCYCADCIPDDLRIDDDDVDTWRYGDHGFTGPVVCQVCHLSIPIYVDGNVEEEKLET